jgi:MFS family permease
MGSDPPRRGQQQAPTAAGRIRHGMVRGLTRNVVALSLVSLLTDVSSEMLVFVVPLFLVNVLAATPAVVGIVEGIAESAGALLRLASGALSDRLGRRRLLVGSGYAISTLAKGLYLVAMTWPVVLLARLGDRIGKGIRTAPRDALIADSTPIDARGRAFGFHRAMDTLGAVAGVGLAALLVGLLQGDAATLDDETFRVIAALALIPAVLGVAVVVVAVRDVPVGTGAGTGMGPGEEPVVVSPGSLAPAAPTGFPVAFWMFVVASGLFALGNSSDAFLVLRSQQLGVGVRDLLLLVVVFNLVGAAIAWPVGALSDRVGRRVLLVVAWSLYAIAYLGFAIAGPIAGADAGALVIGLWLLYGAYYGVAEAVGRALISDLAPAPRRATAFGIANAVVAAMLLPASIVAGILWSSVAPGAPFAFGAGCAAGALVIVIVAVHPPKQTSGTSPAGRSAGS